MGQSAHPLLGAESFSEFLEGQVNIIERRGLEPFLLLLVKRGPSARQETPALRSCKVCSGLIFKVGWHGCWLIRICTAHKQLGQWHCYTVT